MSVPSTPENAKRAGRGGFVSKLTGGRKDWNFNTFAIGSTVWSTVNAEGSASRPGTSGGGSRPGTSHAGPKGVSSSPYMPKDSAAEEEKEAKDQASAAAKSKGSKASADLSPYMSSSSPYISKGGGTIHSRPISRMGPVAAATSLMRRSLTMGSSGSSSRPVTPVQAARPKTRASGEQTTSTQSALRPSTQPAGYRNPPSRGDQSQQPTARPSTQESGRAKADGPGRSTAQAAGYTGSSIGSRSEMPMSEPVPPERGAASSHGTRPSSQGAGGASMNGSMSSDTKGVRPMSSSKDMGPHGSTAVAKQPKPQTPSGEDGNKQSVLDQRGAAADSMEGIHVGRPPSSKGRGVSTPSSRPSSRGQGERAGSKAEHDAFGGPHGKAPQDHMEGLHVGRPPSGKARAVKTPSSRPASRGQREQEPPGRMQHGDGSHFDMEPTRPSSRSSKLVENDPGSRSGKSRGGPGGETRASASGEGHRASASFAISGLGMDNRPTTQERHAAQREQLGFGKRPTTQERQRLTTRAGPRSPSKHTGSADGSKGHASQSDGKKQKSSQSSDGSRLSSSSSHRTSDGINPRGMRGAFHGSAPQGSGQAVPIIDENVDGEAYGMTLGDYISQMVAVNPLDRPLSGASGTMAVEDCIPPDDASLLSDYSDCSYVDPEEGFSDQDYIDPEYRGQGSTSSSSEFEDPEMPRSPWDQNSTDLFFSAAENRLDLRPATAAVSSLMESQHDISGEAADTRQVDLASLPAALFHPRTSENRPPRPPGSGKSDNVWHRTSGSGRKSSGRRVKGVPMSPTSRGSSGTRPKGLRKAQSARPGTSSAEPAEHYGDAEDEYEDDGEEPGGEWDDSHMVRRPPSRQRPPPEALHLFNALGQNVNGGALKPSGFGMPHKGGDPRNSVHSRPKTTATPSRPLSGPQLRLKSDGSGFANATQREVEVATKLNRPPSRGRGPSQLSAGIRHNAAEDFPEPPPKGQGAYDLDIMGIDSDSEWEPY